MARLAVGSPSWNNERLFPSQNNRRFSCFSHSFVLTLWLSNWVGLRLQHCIQYLLCIHSCCCSKNWWWQNSNLLSKCISTTSLHIQTCSCLTVYSKFKDRSHPLLLTPLLGMHIKDYFITVRKKSFMHSWKPLFYGGDENQAARYWRITLGVILLQLDHSSLL